MRERNLKAALQRLELRQAEFARLVDVSARTVNLWATGGQPLPGSVAAYLRLLEAAPPNIRAAELERLGERGKPLNDGIYAISYGAAGSHERDCALAVLRAGKLSGADMNGNVFAGCCRFDRGKGLNFVHLRLGQTGAGQDLPHLSQSARLETTFAVAGAGGGTRALAVIANQSYEIELRFLSPLPD